MAKKFYTREWMEAHTIEKPSRMSFRDLEGTVIDDLTVLGWAGIEKGQNFWWCVCSCNPERFFKVHSTSISKGLTRSCGCRYKNNGGNTPRDLAWAQENTPDNWTVLSYEGMNYPATLKCECGEVSEFSSFYSFTQRCYCEHCSNNHYDKRKQYFESLGYSYIGDFIGEKGYLVECKSCGSQFRKQTGSQSKCPCHVGRQDDSQCAVYIMSSDNLYKIGVSNNPSERMTTFKRNPDVPDLSFHSIEWFYSEESAYAVESLYHDKLADFKHNFRTPFDGSTEYFDCDISQIDKVRKDNTLFFDKMVVEAPPRKEFDFANTGICYGGVWYPTRQELASEFGITRKTLRERLNRGMTLHESLHFDPDSIIPRYEYYGEMKTLREIYEIEKPDMTYAGFTRLYKSKGLEATRSAKSSVKYYDVYGERLSVSEVADKYGIPYSRLRKLGRRTKDYLKEIDPNIVPWENSK